MATETGKDIRVYAKEIEQIFVRAKLESTTIDFTKRIGYNKMVYGTADAVSNMFADDMRIVVAIDKKFVFAEGVFAKRIRDSFNPLYWIDCLVFLPRRLAEYLGNDGDGKGSKIANVIYWCLALLVTIAVTFFGERILGLLFPPA